MNYAGKKNVTPPLAIYMTNTITLVVIGTMLAILLILMHIVNTVLYQMHVAIHILLVVTEVDVGWIQTQRWVSKRIWVTSL